MKLDFLEEMGSYVVQEDFFFSSNGNNICEAIDSVSLTALQF